MAFVPNYEHDIFISYAHVDDEPEDGTPVGWVTTLVNGLKRKLAQLLGRSDAYDLWMDYELSRHVQITPQIMEALQKTAALVVILSPGYVASDWCHREKENFLNFIKERINAGSRVFVVERDKVDKGNRPSEFEGLIGYSFWVQDREGKPPRILGVPQPNPNERRYYDMITDLGYDLADELKRLKTVSDEPLGASIQLTEAGPVVYLAEVTDDLEPQRDEVKRYLAQHIISTRPDTIYPREAAEFREAAGKDLADCKLFVQLLSVVTGKRPPGLSTTYAQLQYDCAKQSAKPILQWRSRELDLGGISDEEHRAFLGIETVMAVGMEVFKKEVVKQACYEAPPTPTPRDHVLLFVNRDKTDNKIAKDVKDFLVGYGAGVVLPMDKGTPSEIREDLEQNLLECDGVIIIYGNITVSWVRKQLQQSWKILTKRETLLPALAIFEGPPLEKDELNLELPNMQILDCRRGLSEADIKAFIQSLKKG